MSHSPPPNITALVGCIATELAVVLREAHELAALAATADQDPLHCDKLVAACEAFDPEARATAIAERMLQMWSLFTQDMLIMRRADIVLRDTMIMPASVPIPGVQIIDEDVE